MSSSDRRGALSALFALSTLAGLGLPVRAFAMHRHVRFPAGSLVLKRKLWRELGGGAAIEVRREWRLNFFEEGTGARVLGQQTNCTASAPEQLSAFTKLECEREVTGLFPMELRPDGLIAKWPSAKSVGIDRAIDSAAERLNAITLPEGEKDAAKRYFAEIGRTSAEFVSQVPRDLFFPETGRRSQSRELKLPDGQTGSYELTVEAKACQESGLLERSERRIVTRVGESARTSLERWTLTG